MINLFKIITFEPETLESWSKTQGSDYVLITSTFRSDRSWSRSILWFWFHITFQRIAHYPRGIIYPLFGNHCLITMINQGSKVTTQKLSVLFCSAWDLALHCEILNEHSQKCHSRNQQKFQQRISNFFSSNLLEKRQISNVCTFGNTNPISKIPILSSSEDSDLIF